MVCSETLTKKEWSTCVCRRGRMYPMSFEWGQKKQRTKQYSRSAALIIIAPKWEQSKHPPLEWVNPGTPCNTTQQWVWMSYCYNTATWMNLANIWWVKEAIYQRRWTEWAYLYEAQKQAKLIYAVQSSEGEGSDREGAGRGLLARW